MKVRLAVAVIVWALCGPGSGAASAAPAAPAPLLSTADLPSGFVARSAASTPPAAAELAGFACRRDRHFAGVAITITTWQKEQYAVEALVARAMSGDAASALQADVVRCTSTLARFAVPGVRGVTAWTLDSSVQGIRLHEQGTLLRRGDLVAAVVGVSVRPVSTTLLAHLTALEAARMPAGASDPNPQDGADRSGSVVGTVLTLLVVYPELADAVANRRRRRAWRPLAGLPGPAVRPGQVTDVSRTARRLHLRALLVFLLETGALATAVFGLLFAVAGRTAGPVLLGVAAALVVAVLAVRRRTVRIGGLPRMRGGSLVALAGALIFALLGLGMLLAGALVQSDNDEMQLQSGLQGLGGDVALLSVPVLALAVMLHRLAVRIALSRPAEGLPEGPPILYLRSFGDDRLKLRVAPYARRSLLERLSTRRRQSFEEIIAEDLQRRAPVAAVGEPGRRRPPIGFVRYSLSDEEWQRHVWQWIMAARTIVVVVGLSDGLAWEMQQLARTGAWRKTIFVFPPVTKDDLIRRRFRLAQLLGGNGLDVADPGTPALLVAFDAAGNCHYWRGKRISAWTYKAALDSVLG
jgi:hypothetical protein